MPETIFSTINQRVLALREESHPLPLWCGHRVFAADGSKINVPRELLSAGYKAPHKYQYYPQGLLSTLYHLGSGLIYDAILSADKSERVCLLSHMEQLSPGDVVVLDRGYFSYLLLVKALEKGLHLICRMQSGSVNKAVQDFWDSDEVDSVVSYQPSAAVKSTIKKQGHKIEYKPVKLRLIKYTIEDETYICSTTLLGEDYPLSEFPAVYHGRWGIEELYKISKVFLDVEDFHGRTERGVKQECYAHILLINLGRIFEAETDKQQPPAPPPSVSGKEQEESRGNLKASYWRDFCGEVSKLKVNFKNCLLVLGRSLVQLLFPQARQPIDFLDRLLRRIGRVRQKVRPGRHYPRESRQPVRKWKSSNGGKVSYA